MNAGRVEKSPRLMRIVEILKAADHPLSSQEIATQAYDFSSSGKIMLNVSTNIGEIRSEENISSGYFIPPSRHWKSDKYPWHDGRPRYWLEAAPGWTPRWNIDDDGNLVPYRKISNDDNSEISMKITRNGKIVPIVTSSVPESDDIPCCRNPFCKKPLSHELLSQGFLCCDENCRRIWKESFLNPNGIEISQGSLF